MDLSAPSVKEHLAGELSRNKQMEAGFSTLNPIRHATPAQMRQQYLNALAAPGGLGIHRDDGGFLAHNPVANIGESVAKFAEDPTGFLKRAAVRREDKFGERLAGVQDKADEAQWKLGMGRLTQAQQAGLHGREAISAAHMPHQTGGWMADEHGIAGWLAHNAPHILRIAGGAEWLAQKGLELSLLGPKVFVAGLGADLVSPHLPDPLKQIIGPAARAFALLHGRIPAAGAVDSAALSEQPGLLTRAEWEARKAQMAEPKYQGSQAEELNKALADHQQQAGLLTRAEWEARKAQMADEPSSRADHQPEKALADHQPVGVEEETVGEMAKGKKKKKGEMSWGDFARGAGRAIKYPLDPRGYLKGPIPAFKRAATLGALGAGILGGLEGYNAAASEQTKKSATTPTTTPTTTPVIPEQLAYQMFASKMMEPYRERTAQNAQNAYDEGMKNLSNLPKSVQSVERQYLADQLANSKEMADAITMETMSVPWLLQHGTSRTGQTGGTNSLIQKLLSSSQTANSPADPTATTISPPVTPPGISVLTPQMKAVWDQAYADAKAANKSDEEARTAANAAVGLPQ